MTHNNDRPPDVASDHDADESAPPMPSDTHAETPRSTPVGRPSFSRQVVQLVAIPALIVLIAIAVAYPLTRMLSVKGTVESHLAVLARAGGLANDKWRAIYSLSAHAEDLKDGQEKAQLNDRLVEILRQREPGDEGKIQNALILLIATLGQPSGFDAVLGQVDSPHAEVRRGVAFAILQWPDFQLPRGAIGTLIRLTGDVDFHVKGYACKALGRFATVDHTDVAEALRNVMDNDDPNDREASWDAAIALARMGDERASGIVAGLLLDREALARMPAVPSGVRETTTSTRKPNMPPAQQDRILLVTLHATGDMQDPRVWDKIRILADKDPNRLIHTVANELVLQRRQDGDEEAAEQ